LGEGLPTIDDWSMAKAPRTVHRGTIGDGAQPRLAPFNHTDANQCHTRPKARAAKDGAFAHSVIPNHQLEAGK
jgi:hypothetical protein